MIVVTEQLMNRGMSRNGGWSAKQLITLGVKDYLKEPGWRKRLIGTLITEQQKNEFLNLKDKHLQKKHPRLF